MWIRHYFFIPPILKGRYTSHTRVCRRYLRHTCVCRRYLWHTHVCPSRMSMPQSFEAFLFWNGSNTKHFNDWGILSMPQISAAYMSMPQISAANTSMPQISVAFTSMTCVSPFENRRNGKIMSWMWTPFFSSHFGLQPSGREQRKINLFFLMLFFSKGRPFESYFFQEKALYISCSQLSWWFIRIYFSF